MASFSLFQPSAPKPGLPPHGSLVGLGHALCLWPVPLKQILTPLGAGSWPPALYPGSCGESDLRRPLIGKWTAIHVLPGHCPGSGLHTAPAHRVPGPLVPLVSPALCGNPQLRAASRTPGPLGAKCHLHVRRPLERARRPHFSASPDRTCLVMEASRATNKR